MIEFDASQVDRLAVEIGKAAPKVAAGLYAVGTKAAVNIKDGMRAQVREHPHFRGMADSISYDVRPTGLRSVAWEIGPDKDQRGGALGNIFFFGTSRQGPIEDIGQSMRAEIPKLERALLDLGDV